MSLIYALISRGIDTILVEYSPSAGNFPQVSKDLLPKIQRETQLTYLYNQKYYFHYINEDNFTYLCLAELDYSKRLAFSFLKDIKNQFVQTFEPQTRQLANNYSLNSQFSSYLKTKMELYNQDPNSDKMNQLKQELYQVKEIMIENIDEILKREDQIEILVKKTTTLNKYAADTKKQAAQVKRDQYWKSIRAKVFIGALIGAIILGFLILI